MLHLHPSRDLVYAVLKPIPDPMHSGRTLADAGDEIIVRAYHQRYPISVLRRLPIETAVMFPDDAVRLCASYEQNSDVPVSEKLADRPVEGRLKLLG